MKIYQPNFEKRGGLVPVYAQDAATGEILMPAYANEEAWRKTLETGIATYYSTSRQRLWVKGAEKSGNTQRVVDVLVDCDGDALVYLVVPQGVGVACHTDARSCFYRSVMREVPLMSAPKAGAAETLEYCEVDVSPELLQQQRGFFSLLALEARLRLRARAESTTSYTAQLLQKGTAKCAKKVGEEAIEVVMAAIGENDQRLIAESADLMYHFLVLLLSRGLTLADVQKALQEREGRSGLAEKAARTPP